MNLRKVVDEIVSKNFGVLVHHLFKQKKIYCLNNDLEYKIKNNVYIRTVIDKIIKKPEKVSEKVDLSLTNRLLCVIINKKI